MIYVSAVILGKDIFLLKDLSRDALRLIDVISMKKIRS